MQIDRIYYPVTTLGFGKRIGIWTIGCNHQCCKCSNPELWKQDKTKDIKIEKIIEYIRGIRDVDGITITGGDPFEQPDELLHLVQEIRRIGYIDIIVYSGYTLDELKTMGSTVNKVLDSIGVLIDGPYVDKLNDNKSIRGSNNQRREISHLDKKDVWRTYIGNPRKEITRRKREDLIDYLYQFYKGQERSQSTVRDEFDHLQKYLHDVLNRSDNTSERYRQIFERFFDDEFVTRPIISISASDIAEYFNGIKDILNQSFTQRSRSNNGYPVNKKIS